MSPQDYEHLPHITCLISPLSILGATLPATWWNLGVSFIYRDRKTRRLSSFFSSFCPVDLFEGVSIMLPRASPSVVPRSLQGGIRRLFIDFICTLVYSKTNNDIFVVAPILCGPIHIYTSSFHAFKQILSVGGSWVKPERAMKDLR